MKISCCMILTNLTQRSQLVKNTIDSLHKCENIFDEKIMSVDRFPGGDNLWFSQYVGEWDILFKEKSLSKSMILNHQNVVKKSSNNVVFYMEDDIIINKLPRQETIEKLFDGTEVNGKPVGFISFNNHVWIQFKENPPHIIDFISNPDNYITVNGDTFLVKSEIIKDRFYLNFPVAFFRKDVMLKLHEYAMVNCRRTTIEDGLTKAWFDLGYDKEYESLIYVKNEILNDIRAGKKITVLDFYNYAQMNFWNNDTTLRHPSVPGGNNVVY